MRTILLARRPAKVVAVALATLGSAWCRDKISPAARSGWARSPKQGDRYLRRLLVIEELLVVVRNLKIGLHDAQALLTGGFLLLTTLLHLPHGPEHWSADLRTKYLSTRPQTQHKRIALVYVTEKTLESHAYTSPTDRQLLADLVRAVDAAKPAVIGFDFIIDRPTEPSKDQALFAALRDAKTKVAVGAIDEKAESRTGKSFQAIYVESVNRPVGHLYFDAHHNTLVISDHVIRQMAKPSDPHSYKNSFARQLVDTIGSFPEPRSPYISWLLDPKDGTETFLTLSADRVMGRVGPAIPINEMLKDKIVLIGGYFIDRDQHLLPLSVVGDIRYPGLFFMRKS